MPVRLADVCIVVAHCAIPASTHPSTQAHLRYLLLHEAFHKHSPLSTVSPLHLASLQENIPCFPLYTRLGTTLIPAQAGVGTLFSMSAKPIPSCTVARQHSAGCLHLLGLLSYSLVPCQVQALSSPDTLGFKSVQHHPPGPSGLFAS